MAKKFAQLLAEMSPERRERIEAEAETRLRDMALAELHRSRRISRTEPDPNVSLPSGNPPDMPRELPRLP